MKAGLRRHANSHLPWGSDPLALPFTEEPAIWGQIVRDGGAGNLTIVDGAINSTTTLVDHNVVSDEVGVNCDIVSSPSRIVIIDPGLYLIRAQLADADAGSSDYGLCSGYGFNTTGAAWSAVSGIRRALGGGAITEFAVLRELDEGDFVTHVAGQDSGSDTTFTYIAALAVARVPGIGTVGAGGGGGGTDTNAIHWGPNTDPTGSGVTISDVSAQPLFDLSTPGLAVVSTRTGWAFIVQNEANTQVFTVGDDGLVTIANPATGAPRVAVQADGSIELNLEAGKAFTLFDSSDNPIMQMTEGSPDLHLPTGGNVVFDL